MANQSTLNALTRASIEASIEVTRLSGEVSKLRAIHTKLNKQSTTIKYEVTLSENIAGDKYDDEEHQEKADLTALEKILVTKKEEILGLLSAKIKQVEADLATANTKAMYDSKSKEYFWFRELCN